MRLSNFFQTTSNTMCACNIRMLVLSIFSLTLSEMPSCYTFLQQQIHIIGNFFGFDKSRLIFQVV